MINETAETLTELNTALIELVAKFAPDLRESMTEREYILWLDDWCFATASHLQILSPQATRALHPAR